MKILVKDENDNGDEKFFDQDENGFWYIDGDDIYDE